MNKLYPRLSSDAQPREPRVMGAAVAAFSASLVADRMPDSDVIRISFRHSDAETSARALNLLVDHFKEKHLQAFSEPEAAAFLQEKVNTYREALARAEERLKALQIESKSFSVDDQRAALFQQRRDIETGLKDSRNQIAGLQEKLRYLNSQQERLSTAAGRGSPDQNKAIADANAQLLDLHLQEQKLLSSFSETSRSVQSVRKQIDLVKDFLDKQKAVMGQGEFAQELEKQAVNVVAALRYQQARRDSLLEQLGLLEQQLGKLTAQDGAYRELLHEREANEKNYRVYVQKLEEARISEEMDREKIANISVIQEAVVPLRPIWPSKTLNALVGVLLGLTMATAGRSPRSASAGRSRGCRSPPPCPEPEPRDRGMVLDMPVIPVASRGGPPGGRHDSWRGLWVIGALVCCGLGCATVQKPTRLQNVPRATWRRSSRTGNTRSRSATSWTSSSSSTPS